MVPAKRIVQVFVFLSVINELLTATLPSMTTLAEQTQTNGNSMITADKTDTLTTITSTLASTTTLPESKESETEELELTSSEATKTPMTATSTTTIVATESTTTDEQSTTVSRRPSTRHTTGVRPSTTVVVELSETEEPEVESSEKTSSERTAEAGNITTTITISRLSPTANVQTTNQLETSTGTTADTALSAESPEIEEPELELTTMKVATPFTTKVIPLESSTTIGTSTNTGSEDHQHTTAEHTCTSHRRPSAVIDDPTSFQICINGELVTTRCPHHMFFVEMFDHCVDGKFYKLFQNLIARMNRLNTGATNEPANSELDD